MTKGSNKKVVFLSGPAFPPPLLLVAGPLKKELYFCGFPTSMTIMKKKSKILFRKRCMLKLHKKTPM